MSRIGKFNNTDANCIRWKSLRFDEFPSAAISLIAGNCVVVSTVSMSTVDAKLKTETESKQRIEYIYTHFCCDQWTYIGNASNECLLFKCIINMQNKKNTFKFILILSTEYQLCSVHSKWFLFATIHFDEGEIGPCFCPFERPNRISENSLWFTWFTPAATYKIMPYSRQIVCSIQIAMKYVTFS